MDDIIECPSGLRVRVTKLKVRQFKLLGNRKALESGDVFEQFLAACAKEIIDPGPAYPRWSPGTTFDWKRALTGDRFTALLGIRTRTHAAPFDFDVTCQHCRKEIGWTVDLAAIPRVPYPAESIQTFVDGREIHVDVDGHDVSFKLMTGAEEERIRNRLAALETTDKRTRKHPFDPMVDGAVERLSAVSGMKKADVRDWYEDLDVDEMLKIGRAQEATAGGVDTTIEVVHTESPMCGGTTKVELPFGSKEFWIPRGPGLGTAGAKSQTPEEGEDE